MNDSGRYESWIFKFSIIFVLFLYGWCVVNSDRHHRDRYHPGAGHDPAQFYYARILVSDLKASLKDDSPCDSLENRLKKHKFMTEGLPGLILLKAGLAFFALQDLSEPPAEFDSGLNYIPFRIEYGLYIFLAAVTAYYIFRFIALAYGSRTGYLAALAYLVGSETAFFIMGWKVYPIPSVMFMMSLIYYYTAAVCRTRNGADGSGKRMLVAGMVGGFMLMCNIKLIFVFVLLGLAEICARMLAPDESPFVQVFKRWGVLVLGVLFFPIAYDATIHLIFVNPVVEFPWPWGVRSWGFIDDLLQFQFSYTGQQAEEFIRANSFVQWPAFYFDLLRLTEGWPTLLLGICGVFLTVSLLFSNISKHVFWREDHGGKFVLSFLLLMGVVGPVIVLFFVHIMDRDSVFSSGRTYYQFVVFLYIFSGFFLSWLWKTAAKKFVYCLVFAIGIFFCSKAYSIYQMSVILNTPGKGFWGLINTELEFPTTAFPKYASHKWGQR